MCKGLVENQHAVGLGHPDHVHSAAVPAGPLKLQVPPARLHQALCSFYAQSCSPMPAPQPRVQKRTEKTTPFSVNFDDKPSITPGCPDLTQSSQCWGQVCTSSVAGSNDVLGLISEDMLSRNCG